MTIPSALTNNTTPSASTQLDSSSSNNQLGPDSFITLLTAQLQAQDPLNPMDPSEMVDQLTQINSLQQLVQIQTDLQQVLGETPTTSQTTTQTSAA